jgi:cytochrome c oxidase assembly protein subunit 15
VGLLTIATAAAAKLTGQPLRLRLAAYAAVALVMFQGLLGGLTVLLRLPAVVSVAHLATAMAFFSLLLFIAWSADAEEAPASGPSRGAPLVWLTYAITYLQIVLGGVVRHTGAAAACTDFPLCNGSLALSGSGQTIHMAHRIFALSVALLVVIVAVQARGWRDAPDRARRLARAGVLLIGLQIVLGAYTVSTGLDLLVVTAHLGVAALLLGNTLLLGLSLRLSPQVEVASGRLIDGVIAPQRP